MSQRSVVFWPQTYLKLFLKACLLGVLSWASLLLQNFHSTSDAGSSDSGCIEGLSMQRLRNGQQCYLQWFIITIIIIGVCIDSLHNAVRTHACNQQPLTFYIGFQPHPMAWPTTRPHDPDPMTPTLWPDPMAWPLWPDPYDLTCLRWTT